MENKTILIFANGVITDKEWLLRQLARADVVIAADGGIRHLLAVGHQPDILIGDLDSLPEGFDVELVVRSDVKVIRHPPAKDETDLELALLLAADHFPGADLIILGGFGGRVDQTLANILLLAHPRLSHCSIRLEEAGESAWLVRDRTEIYGRPGDRVSFLPLGGAVEVASTTGLRWPLHDERLAFGPARGISNELTATKATVQLNSGMLLCIQAHQAGSPIDQDTADD
jgi:thiamine pyrophosphokinase